MSTLFYDRLAVHTPVYLFRVVFYSMPENLPSTTFPDIKLPVKPSEQRHIGQNNACSSALVLSEAADQFDGLILVVTEDSSTAEQLQKDLMFFTDSRVAAESEATGAVIFPDWEILPYDSFSPHQDIVSQRLSVLYHLPQMRRGVLIIPVTTLMHRLPPVSYVKGQCMLLKKGDVFNSKEQQKYLVAAGYLHVETVYRHGEFAQRGSIVDIFPMGAAAPVRLDLFDDSIDSIRTFDAETQRTLEIINDINILPAHEYPLNQAARQLFKQHFQNVFDVDYRSCPMYMDISKGLASAGAEYYLPLFFEQETATLFDYLPDRTLLVSLGELSSPMESFWQDTRDRFESYSVDKYRPLLPPEQVLLTVDQIFSLCKAYPRLNLKTSKLPEKAGNYNLPVSFVPDLTINSRAKNPYAALSDFLSQTDRVLFVAESAGRREQLLELLARADIFPVLVTSWHDFLRDGNITHALTTALIDTGFWHMRDNFAVITESQLLGNKVIQRRRRGGEKRYQGEQTVRNLNELKEGDPVVHIDHGVGRYDGLQSFELDSQQQEFLALSYAGNARLYVPVAQLHLIARYSGSRDENAPLHRLGTDQWEKIRRKAAEKVNDVAAELLDIYARRQAVEGESFTWDALEYSAFANEFPFETTEDQQLAIDAVLADMKGSQPMDRLICGDVGFGKTEVAMRAAFIAIQNQKQVIILAPTTLLAQQHYTTFSDRFAEWPVMIEVLSRFKTGKQADEVKKLLASGHIDIIIGTHKLLNKEIQFNQPGLLVIDEEHRFGVRQKERMKALRTHINVLTLTATPIPRTLNMAMASIRDLSIITTPPAKRLSIKTFIHSDSRRLIKEAILRELLRGGQVYYLHNDVKTIGRAADELSEMIPEARIAIGHGQMRERELERIMQDFYHKHYNVLVCTTIIETGIDIPSANTIIIHRADKFGLAQLHQLRGRVGRSHHQAYAYLLTPDGIKITDDATKRLEAIATTTELGSGFMLATHDLEIRGAGELLGEDQSGQIEGIGFTLYMEMLEKTVKTLQNNELPQSALPLYQVSDVNLHTPALISEDYIGSPHTRLILYKRIASCHNNQELREIQVEMIDRFGLLPDTVKNLFRVTSIKLQASDLGIDKIESGSEHGKITFGADTGVKPDVLIGLIQKHADIYQLRGPNTLRYTAEMAEIEQRFVILEKLLALLSM